MVFTVLFGGSEDILAWRNMAQLQSPVKTVLMTEKWEGL